VLGACRVFPAGVMGDLVLVTLFGALAVATYRYGLRAPTVISAMKGPLIFAAVLAALALAFVRLGGPGAMFDRAAAALAGQPAGDAPLLLGSDQYSAYTTLALSSALALLLYPHVLTAGFAASGPDTLRRMSVALPVWAGILGLFGTLGIAALAVGIHTPQAGSEAAVPLLVCYLMPPLAAGFVFGAITIGALVPAAVMSVAVATLFVRNVYVEYFHPTATPKRQVRIARVVSLITKLGAVAFVFGLRDQAAINLQLLGGVWILQTLPTVVIGLFTHCRRYRALLAGWAAGMAASTFLVVRQGFSSVMPFDIGGSSADVYVGLVALLLNFVVVALAVAAAGAADHIRTRRRSTT